MTRNGPYSQGSRKSLPPNSTARFSARPSPPAKESERAAHIKMRMLPRWRAHKNTSENTSEILASRELLNGEDLVDA